MKDQVVELIGGAVSQLLTDGVLTEGDIPTPQVDHTRDPSHGDLATNIAMVLAKRAGMAPRDLAAAIVERIPHKYGYFTLRYCRSRIHKLSYLAGKQYTNR